ncbi:MAG: hypothetical protein Q4A97_10885 [Comamonadaceae bacterium]|nr:hypothetical protein [Comamonadaceae bacterium]
MTRPDSAMAPHAWLCTWLARLLKTLGLLALGIALLWAGLAIWALLRGPTPEQQRAVAALHNPAATPASLAQASPQDGFAALWLLARDVPAEQQQAVAWQDVAHFAQYRGDAWQAPSEHFAPLTPQEHASWCRVWDEQPCLQRVHAELPRFQTQIQAHQALLQRIAALADYGYVSQPFVWRMDVPLPSYQHLFYPATQYAVQFWSGQPEQAMHGLCRYTDTVQRLLQGPHSTLIAQMIAAAQLRQSAALLADMLYHAPQVQAPSSCLQAFAPQPEHAQALCDIARNEYQFVLGTLRHPLPPWARDAFLFLEGSDLESGWAHPSISRWQRILVALLPAWSHERTLRHLIAPRYAWACAPDARQAQAQADFAKLHALGLAHAQPLRWQAACALAPRACLWSTGEPIFAAQSRYPQRLHDREATRRAIASLLWLRMQPAPIPAAGASELQAWQALLAQRPAGLHLQGSRPEIRALPDGTWALHLALHDSSRATALQLPFAPLAR